LPKSYGIICSASLQKQLNAAGEPATFASMEEDDHDFDHGDERNVPAFDRINWASLRSALTSLQMFDDPYMQMQATNLGIVDQFLTDLEFQVLRESSNDDRDLGAMLFLNAQSQMWMFSAYELLRTWRQRINDAQKLLDSGEINDKIHDLLKDQGFQHFGMEIRAGQLQRLLSAPDTRQLMNEDLRLTHILYKRLDYLRVALAKHEVKGRRGSIALAPGYGRLDIWTGSVQYELEAGQVSLGTLSRRDVADGIRAFADRSEIPTLDTLKSFDEFMKADFADVNELFSTKVPRR
jgi:hypothetical protein